MFVKVVEENQPIEIEWPIPVEWLFTPQEDGFKFVSITASGFTGTDDEKVDEALDSTEGFNLAISGYKAFLEHGIELNLVNDKKPV